MFIYRYAALHITVFDICLRVRMHIETGIIQSSYTSSIILCSNIPVMNTSIYSRLIRYEQLCSEQSLCLIT